MPNIGTVAAIGSLADPIRMQLFRFITDRGAAVTRDEAAEALAIPLTKAKFHLDRLAEEGILETEYRRLTGKRGPGAGRPAKLYRRSTAEFHVSLPERRYDIMGEILARAVTEAQHGTDLNTAIEDAAYSVGRDAATIVREGQTRQKRQDLGAPSGGSEQPEHLERPERSSLTAAQDLLTTLGYDATVESTAHAGAAPEADSAEQVLRLRNCPFDALAQDHRSLVCGTNVHYVQGVLDEASNGGFTSQLHPCPGYCCVAVTACEEASSVARVQGSQDAGSCQQPQ